MSGAGPPRPGRGELRRRICRLVCVPIREHGGDDPQLLVDERAEYPWGGYTFFRGELEPVRSLIARLRAAAAEPLLLASDLERGLGQHLAAGTSFPPPMCLGASGDSDLAYAVGEATAREAAEVGLNCVFAPVLDLANEPANPIVGTRSFGDDPEAVAELGTALVRGLQDGGVLATAKHFPGHGRTTLDSHEALPVVTAPAAELRAEDLVPFRRAVEAGVALVMSAHVVYPALEQPGGGKTPPPATLSPSILTGLLRGELRFRGPVVSDALMMGALFGVERGEVAARALEAGVDCLLYPPEPRALVHALARRVEEGRLDVAVIDRAIGNLADALGRLGSGRARRAREGGRDASGSGVGVGERCRGEAVELAVRAARAGLVALGDPAPVPGAARSLVLLVLDGGIAREEVILPAAAAAPGREFRWVVPEERVPAPPPDLAEFDEVCLAWFSPIRAWKGRAGMSREAGALAARVLAARPDAVLISFSSPFILASLPAPRGAILAFGEVPACQIAVAEALAGDRAPAGHLPVQLDRRGAAPPVALREAQLPFGGEAGNADPDSEDPPHGL